MNARGQYGKIGGPGRVHVGAFLVHTLELKQRYNNVKTAAVQALLNDLSRAGVASSIDTNRWQIALKEDAWVLLTWYPDYSALEATITDRELRPVDQIAATRGRYEAILRTITLRLKNYGATTVGATTVGATTARDVYLGQGSIIPHTPTEVEDELKQLHGELMTFGQEAIELIKPLEAQAKATVQRARDEEMAAWNTAESFQPLVKEVDRIEKLLNEAGVSATITNEWREQFPPYDNITFMPLVDSRGVLIKKAEDLKKQFVAAKVALDNFMPKAERMAAVKRSRELSEKRSKQEHEQLGEFPLVKWSRTVWLPFFDGWNAFYYQKIDIPAQTWPLSGTWDRIQEYRRQFIDLRNKAPFKAQGPTPLDPSERTDPSLTGGLRDIWGGAGNVFGIVKWGLIGALGIGAVVALSSVVSNLRKGKDPADKYVELIRQRASRAPRASRVLPEPRAQLALPPGEGA